MRILLALVPLFAVAACGGSVAPVNPPAEAERAVPPPSSLGPPLGQPTAPVSSPPAPPAATACDASGAELSFDSADAQARALENAWDLCVGTPICPPGDPHLFFGYGTEKTAACSHWCGGDGGACPTSDRRFWFTYAVKLAPSGEATLEMSNADAMWRYRVRFRASQPMPSMTLTDLDSGLLSGLQAVGIPVK